MSSPSIAAPLASFDAPDRAIHRLTVNLDIGLSAIACFSGFGVYTGRYLLARDADGQLTTQAILIFVALSGAIGLLMQRSARFLPRLALSGLLAGIGGRLALRSRWTGKLTRALPWRAEIENQMAEAISRRVHALNADDDSAADPYTHAVRDSRLQSRRIVSELYQDADALSALFGRFETSGARLDKSTRAARDGCAGAKIRFAKLTDDAVALTGLVGAITADIRRVTVATTTLSERALDTQKCVATLDNDLPGAVFALEAVRSNLNRLSNLGQQAIAEAAKNGEPGRAMAIVAADIQAASAQTLASLTHVETQLGTTSTQVADWLAVTQSLLSGVSQMMDAQSGLHDLLGHQGVAMTSMIGALDDAHADLENIQAHLAEVTRHGSSHSPKVEDLRYTAARLPRHADQIAALMRDVPDFYPPQEFNL